MTTAKTDGPDTSTDKKTGLYLPHTLEKVSQAHKLQEDNERVCTVIDKVCLHWNPLLSSP